LVRTGTVSPSTPSRGRRRSKPSLNIGLKRHPKEAINKRDTGASAGFTSQ
jgi:hypothetical protein